MSTLEKQPQRSRSKLRQEIHEITVEKRPVVSEGLSCQEERERGRDSSNVRVASGKRSSSKSGAKSRSYKQATRETGGEKSKSRMTGSNKENDICADTAKSSFKSSSHKTIRSSDIQSVPIAAPRKPRSYSANVAAGKRIAKPVVSAQKESKQKWKDEQEANEYSFAMKGFGGAGRGKQGFEIGKSDRFGFNWGDNNAHSKQQPRREMEEFSQTEVEHVYAYPDECVYEIPVSYSVPLKGILKNWDTKIHHVNGFQYPTIVSPFDRNCEQIEAGHHSSSNFGVTKGGGALAYKPVDTSKGITKSSTRDHWLGGQQGSSFMHPAHHSRSRRSRSRTREEVTKKTPFVSEISSPSSSFSSSSSSSNSSSAKDKWPSTWSKKIPQSRPTGLPKQSTIPSDCNSDSPRTWKEIETKMGMVNENLFGSSFCDFDKKDFEIECEDKYDEKCDEKWEEKLNENCKKEDLIIEDSVWSTEKGRKTTNLDFGVKCQEAVPISKSAGSSSGDSCTSSSSSSSSSESFRMASPCNSSTIVPGSTVGTMDSSYSELATEVKSDVILPTIGTNDSFGSKCVKGTKIGECQEQQKGLGYMDHTKNLDSTKHICFLATNGKCEDCDYFEKISYNDRESFDSSMDFEKDKGIGKFKVKNEQQNYFEEEAFDI